MDASCGEGDEEKVKEPSSAGRLSLAGAGPAMADLVLRAQHIFAAASGLSRPSAVSLGSRAGCYLSFSWSHPPHCCCFWTTNRVILCSPHSHYLLQCPLSPRETFGPQKILPYSLACYQLITLFPKCRNTTLNSLPVSLLLYPMS